MKYLLLLLFLTRSVSLKLCMDCKHFKGSFFGNQYGKCDVFSEIKEDYNECIDGSVPRKTIEYTYCSTARKFDHLCGKEGKLFEKK